VTDQKLSGYPLMEHAADSLKAASGRPLAEVTLEALGAGELGIADTQISAEALRAQAEVARRAGYPQLAENLARAAELTAVPNAEVLKMYDMLRPGRSSHAELLALAERLEGAYAAPACAALVREAAEVYRRRGLSRRGA
jgi:propanediol dehydratase small subunit